VVLLYAAKAFGSFPVHDVSNTILWVWLVVKNLRVGSLPFGGANVEKLENSGKSLVKMTWNFEG
jgi:hypothetical protein